MITGVTDPDDSSWKTLLAGGKNVVNMGGNVETSTLGAGPELISINGIVCTIQQVRFATLYLGVNYPIVKASGLPMLKVRILGLRHLLTQLSKVTWSVPGMCLKDVNKYCVSWTANPGQHDISLLSSHSLMVQLFDATMYGTPGEGGSTYDQAAAAGLLGASPSPPPPLTAGEVRLHCWYQLPACKNVLS